MINLRYHIVSITAVFLALGIGLFMGSSFLADAAISGLRNNLDDAEKGIDRTSAENSDLRARLNQGQDQDEQLEELGAPQLFRDRLTDMPVVLVVSEGTDQGSLDVLRRAITNSDGTLHATLTLTGKMALEGEDADTMSEVLDSASNDPTQLRRLLANRMADALLNAAATAPETGTVPPGGDAPPAGEEPTLIRALRENGFLDVVAPEGGDEEVALLSQAGYRFVFVSGIDARMSDSELFLPVVRAMAADDPAPIVVASAATGDEPEENRELVVGPIRNDEAITDRVVTVDNLETFAGVTATILSLDRLDDGGRGHYGVGENADSLLPLPSS